MIRGDILFVVQLLLVGLALPPALKQGSWRRFFIALALSAAGVLVPLFVFLASSFLMPDWKGACPHGWLDCFHVGKLALTPIVLWAVAAFYALDIYQVRPPVKNWVVLGLFLGAIVSWICFLFGAISAQSGSVKPLQWFLIVPFYTAVWYTIRTVQTMKTTGLKPGHYLWAACGSFPFWIGSFIWSRQQYASLPDQAPSCFVVTAATQGHRVLVGELREVTRAGEKRLATNQLLTLWQFEASWRLCAPASHTLFRLIYNRVGPLIASRITSPWTADLTFIAIKPFEYLARLALKAEPGIVSSCSKEKRL